MSKAAELAALIGSQTALSNRNLIINGAMQVAQRGTSFSNVSSGTFTLDRFQISSSNLDNLQVTISQSSTTPGGFSNSLKAVATTAETAVAADEQLHIRTKFEGQDLQQLQYGSSAAQATTLSFNVRSNVTGTYAVYLYSPDGVRIISKTYTINTADTWEYKTITFPGDTGGTINDDNGEGMQVSWHLLAGTNYTDGTGDAWVAYADGEEAANHTADWGEDANDEWYITGIQLEVGEQATPFEHRSFGDELARCQRYFYRVSDDDRALYAEQGPATDQLWWNFGFPVEMRIRPDFTVYGATNKGQAGKAYDTGGGDYESVETTHYSTLTRGHILITRGTANVNYSIQGAEFDAEL